MNLVDESEDDLIVHDQATATPDAVESNLDPTVEVILGTAPTQTSKDPLLHAAVASRWTSVLIEGLHEDTKPALIKKYCVPENLPLLKVPQLNPEIRAAISSQILKRDQRLVQKQEQLGACISALGRAVTLLLEKKGGGDELNHLELLSDAARLLCDYHHTETTIRRELITINLNKDLKDTLSEAPVDNFLFGQSLEERIKAAKSLERSCSDLKPVKSKIVRKLPRPLNTRGPAPITGGARVGQQIQDKAPFYRNRHFQQQTLYNQRTQVGKFRRPQEDRNARRQPVVRESRRR